MTENSDLYEILEVPNNAAQDEIKSAFRMLALIHHPDKNDASPESEVEFIIIHHAYSILVDPVKRREYDNYLKTSPGIKVWREKSAGEKSVLSGRVISRHDYLNTISNQFNFLLWDVEEILRRTGVIYWNREKLRHIDVNIWDRKHSGNPLGYYVMKILIFIDKWVLTPAGYKNHFINSGINSRADCENYFFSIRTRLEDFRKNLNTGDLIKTISGYDVRLIDAIFEAQSHAVHYISFINKVIDGEIEFIPPFQHSHSCY